MIKDFDVNNLTFIGDTLISWIDTRTEFGFVREFNHNKYYYDNKNNLINVEKKFNYLPFPLNKKDTELDNKIGTIDLETFGSDSGTGYHQVYAGGWAVKGKTNLFYINPDETS